MVVRGQRVRWVIGSSITSPSWFMEVHGHVEEEEVLDFRDASHLKNGGKLTC